MSEPVTIAHGGLTVTTNTAGSEADLRQSLDMPAAAPAAPESPAPPAASTSEVPRDDKGRFAKTEAATPPVETPTPPPEPAAPDEAAHPATEEELDRRHPLVRMRQAFKQKAAAEQRAAAAEAALAQLRASAMPPTPPAAATPPDLRTQSEPTFEQFANEADPYTAYMQAWARWDRQQAIAQARADWEQDLTTRQRAQQFAHNLQQGRTAYPDFEKVLTEADTLGLQVSAVMRDAIAESPRAADFVYFLATHPEECMQIAEETESMPLVAVPVMRRLLERSLGPRVTASNGAGTAARPATSTAKPPVTPVGSSPVVSDEPPGDSASAAEHARYWNRKLKVPGTK